MIEAVIFDMDGLMIDSEKLWRQAEIIAFGRVGLTLTDDQCRETTGLRIDEMVAYWHRKFPWKNASLKEVEADITKEVTHLILTVGEAMPGIFDIVDFFKKKGVKIALASSSSYAIIEAGLTRLGLLETIPITHSAQDEILGKPHPSVYLSAAKKLDVSPLSCLALEDSINGTLAAKSARMKVISVPEHPNKAFGIADLVLTSLTEFSESDWNTLNSF